MATFEDFYDVPPRTEYCLSMDFRQYQGVLSFLVEQTGGPPLELRSLYIDGAPVPWAPINNRPRPVLDFATLQGLDLGANPDIEGDMLTVVVANNSPSATVSARLVATTELRTPPPGYVPPRRFGQRG